MMENESNPQIFQVRGLNLPVLNPIPGIKTQVEVPFAPESAQQFTFFPEDPEEASEETKEAEDETEKVQEVKTRDATLKKTRSWWSCA